LACFFRHVASWRDPNNIFTFTQNKQQAIRQRLNEKKGLSNARKTRPTGYILYKFSRRDQLKKKEQLATFLKSFQSKTN
jgi:hypothetical protein